MREILFRGKKESTGEWVEGSIVHRTKYYGDSCDDYFIVKSGEFDCDYYDAELVDHNTVGQYTGIKDDNGTRVYEGDVIERRSSRRNYRDAVVAEEWNCGCCFDVYGFSTYEGVVHLRDNFVVIGNIHDNPELLKEGGEE